MRGTHTTRDRQHPKAFTLVELLIVIGIIALLVGILMPAISGAMDMARRTQTAAMLKVLETGLEQYRAEPDLGREFPPSHDTRADGSSYLPVRDYTPGDYNRAYGANLLVWGLCGVTARMDGTVGFPETGTIESICPTAIDGVWPARYGPFVTTGGLRIGVPERGFYTNSSGNSLIGDDPFWTILDPWGNVILYYRANPTALPVDVFNYSDNAPFTTRVSMENDYIDTIHDVDNFRRYTHDYRVPGDPIDPAVYAPQNRDSFLLISAGPDGRYGTADDVTNFEHTEPR